MNTAPDTYLGNVVPDGVKAAWRSWEAAEWRQAQYLATNRLYPPDERFNVKLPEGLCERHAQNWLDHRNMRFDPVTGDSWPGTPGSPFLFVGHNMDDLREQRRAEWDEKASGQMRKVERMCRGGRSDGCRPLNRAATRTAEEAQDRQRRIYIDGCDKAWIDSSVDSAGIRWIAPIGETAVEATRDAVRAETGFLSEIGRCW